MSEPTNMPAVEATENPQASGGEDNNPAPNPTVEQKMNHGKVFTQDDVNRIVSDRLSKEKAKADTALSEREEAVAWKEYVLEATDVLTKRGYFARQPEIFLNILKCSDIQSLEQALSIIHTTINGPPPELHPGSGTKPIFGNSDPIRKAFGLGKNKI